jgi:hypothetical protein
MPQVPNLSIIFYLKLIFESSKGLGSASFEPILVLTPTIADSKLERNQFLTQLEQLHNLEQKPSHQLNFQQHVEPVETI